MLRFFRQIRQKLLTDNKFSKYLLYAIGEILLVMIGILLALQVNNWNEERKSRALEKKYLGLLKKEFVYLKDNCSYLREFHELQAGYAETVLTAINTDSTLDNSILHFSVLLAGWNWNGEFIENTWAEMKSTGNQVLISNDTLKDAIEIFHFNLAQLKSFQNEWSTYNLKYRDLSHSVLDPDLRIRVIKSVENAYRIGGDIQGTLKPQESIRIELRKDPLIGHYLTDIWVCRSGGARVLMNLERQATYVLELINNELK
jgi:hypothetical protein